jgi:hypothetical protein
MRPIKMQSIRARVEKLASHCQRIRSATLLELITGNCPPEADPTYICDLIERSIQRRAPTLNERP